MIRTSAISSRKRSFCFRFASNRAHRSSLTKPASRADWSQTIVGIIDPQVQPKLSPRRKHAVGLVRALADQVVDQNPCIAVSSPEDDWIQRTEPLAPH